MGSNSYGQTPAKFIPAAIELKMAKVLYYYCDQPFSLGHKCGVKSTQLFLVEVPRYEETKLEDSSEFFREIDFEEALKYL